MDKALKLTLFLALLGQHLLFSQDYLGDDLAFFENKSKLYQHWLDAKGMGEVLKVDLVELEKNGYELELILIMRTTDHDMAIAMWESLVKGYETRNPGSSLGEGLFKTFVRMMEIPPAQGNVQVYMPQKNGPGYNPCFYVWFWEENGMVKDETRPNNCKAQPLEIAVKTPPVKKLTDASEVRVNSGEEARVVFDRILQYARRHYEVKRCQEREPRVGEEKITDYSLSFSVNDLCQEVLKDEDKSLWCDFVELWWGPCNDMRRERLEFKFTYIPTRDGYLLAGSLTGKFGSGVYRPRKSGYMDMEPDFEEDYLAPYVEDFQKALKNYLEKPERD